MIEIIKPDWDAPKNIVAFTTTRQGGVSVAPYDSLNLGIHVQDDPIAVRKNRVKLMEQFNLPQEPAWLTQTHSTIVVKNTLDYSLCEADASFADEPDLVCTVLTADCLPLLVCDKQGTQVAAIHAGWRGLADGVIEATIERLSAAREDLLVWLGPAIGPRVYEVGEDVYQAFIDHDQKAKLGFRAHTPNKWLMNVYALAHQRLSALGVLHISGGEHCTYTEAEKFYSFRRDGVTGRMASMIYLK
jgi:YfiH family protein